MRATSGSLALLFAVALAVVACTSGDGAATPSVTVTPEVTATSTAEATETVVASPSSTVATPTSAATPAATETAAPTTPSSTPVATASPSPTATQTPATATAAPTATTTATVAPTASPTATATPSVPAGVTVTIQGYGYQPQTLEIDAGTTVTWVNRDPVEHDADAKDGTWDGPLLADGESWPRTFEVSGDFLVTCSIHPYMQGLVKVR